MMPNTPHWDPHTDIYKEQEYGMMDYNGNVKPKRINTLNVESVMDMAIGEIERSFVNESLSSTLFVKLIRMLNKVVKGMAIELVNSGRRKKKITAEEIAQKLNIPYEMAKRTLRATTQLEVRKTEEPSLTR